MKVNQFMKKVIALVLVFAMIVPMFANLGTNTKEVQAAETATKEDVIGYVIVPKASVDTTGSQPTVASGYESNKYADYLFGGWFSDAEAMTVATTDAEKLYARFVPSDVLSTKCQVTTGLVTDTNVDQYRNCYVLRFVSSIDSLDYRHVGFEISYKDGDTIVTKTNKTNTVFERIESTTGTTAEGQDTYAFSPKVMSTKSEYFITAKWPVVDTANEKEKDYTVRAFWMTMDGTKVYGESRTVCVNDGLTATNSINLSVANTGNVSVVLGETLAVSEDANLTAKVIGIDNSSVQVRISGVNKATMKSATKFTLTKDNATVGSEIYRNLYTKYDGTTNTVDKSWYETNTSASEYIIATSADLYGLADVLNDNTFAFGGRTLYLVSDIKVNDEVLIKEPTDTNYKKWYSVETGEYTDRPTYADWIPGGRSGKMFNGTFDGQMHTISGLYCVSNGDWYTGLFGQAYTTAKIKNIKLTNSFFSSTALHTGSIVGRSYGTQLNSVYSEAIVETSSTYGWCGGLVGYAQDSIQMEKCWFNGSVKNTATSNTADGGGTGGLVGRLTSGTATLVECLNSGTVDASKNTSSTPEYGGLVGDVATTATMTDCLNTGAVVGTYGASIAGSVSGGTLTCNTTYGTNATNVVTYCSGSNFIINYDCWAGVGQAIRNNDNCKTAPVVSLGNDMTSFSVNALTALGGFDFTDTWTVVLNEPAILKVFESVVMDTSWYDEDEDTYVLYDKADLWGFSALSQKTDFAGKTIKLGNDIVVNTGDTASWKTSAPKYAWTPASSVDLPFAGTFDGGMHTISGLYMNTTSNNSGLFSTTSATSVIKNLKVENSYFTSTGAGLGSIVGVSAGKLENVYSNSEVIGNNACVGGLIGQTSGQVATVQYGWFAGNVKNTATGSEGGDRRGTGGLIGSVRGNTVLEDCLNNGTVDATATSNAYCKAGGLVGGVEATFNLTFTDCLNTGTVSTNYETGSGYFIGFYDKCIITCYTSYGYGNARMVGYRQGGGSFHGYYQSGNNLTYYTRDDGNYTGAPATQCTSTTTQPAGFDFTNGTWLTVEGGTPVLNFSSDLENMDKRWYDASATEYVLYDKGDLYGFAELAKTTNFAGKTVKVGSDILVNEGNAANWSGVNHPNTAWEPIGYKSSDSYNAFTGTFDGQGHTISGLYFNRTNRYAGLFAAVGESGIIQNLRLENSYFESNNWDFGSITGRLDGKIYMVYSDAIIRAASVAVGGIAGSTYGSEMENCWYNGDILKTADDTWRLGIGGIVGMATASTSESKVSLYNCLNTADFDISVYTSTHPCVGGLIGRVYVNNGLCPQVSIDACLNTGIFTKNDTVVAGGVGPIVGYNSGAKDCVLINRTYATTDKLDNNITDEGWNVVNAGDIKGDDAKTNMPYLGGWDEDWRCVEGKFPEIIFSTEGFGTGIAASTDELTALTSLYANRSLYQGELHAHAKTYGKGQGPLQGDDGNVDLETWANSMEGLGLDFAASLDHNQTKHYELLDKSKFVYGTEAGTTITDATKTGNYKGELHYAMLFPDDSGLKNVLTQFNFDYSETTDLFSYKNFNRETFTNLIKTVQNDTNKGFFIHVHPTQTSYVSTDYLDEYHFVDYAGFEVFYLNTPTMDDMTEAEKQTYAQYGAYGSGETRTHYTLWTQLLNKGKRLYATSGSDTHRALNNYALTSVYSIADAATDKGKIITQLRDGDFTAGAVGIQMRIDDTKMGGHFNFKDTSRLVVNIDKFHFSDIVVSTHKYRVDVITDDGVVYRHPLTIDSSTSKPTNGKIALDVNPNSKYYRVEVVDATTGYRIAIGQPIWNDK